MTPAPRPLSERWSNRLRMVSVIEAALLASFVGVYVATRDMIWIYAGAGGVMALAFLVYGVLIVMERRERVAEKEGG